MFVFAYTWALLLGMPLWLWFAGLVVVVALWFAAPLVRVLIERRRDLP